MWSCQLAGGQAFYILVWPGNGAQYRGGAGWLLWLVRQECGEALLPSCSGFVVISKVEETSDASPPHISFGLIFVIVAISSQLERIISFPF